MSSDSRRVKPCSSAGRLLAQAAHVVGHALRQPMDVAADAVVPTMPALDLTDETIRDAALDPACDFTARVAAVEQAFDELAEMLAPAAAPI